MISGLNKVLMLAGDNKITKDVEKALEQIRNTIANMKRNSVICRVDFPAIVWIASLRIGSVTIS